MKRVLGLLIILLFFTQTAFAQQKYIGEVFLTAGTFCPRDTVPAHGQLLDIASYQVLYSVIGNTYGGDGRASFQLPDLRGRVPIGNGDAPSLSYRRQGDKGGAEWIMLQADQIPAHNHALLATNKRAKSADPSGKILALSGTYASGTPNRQLSAASIAHSQGGHASVPIMQPYLTMLYCLVVNGQYPPRP